MTKRSKDYNRIARTLVRKINLTQERLETLKTERDALAVEMLNAGWKIQAVSDELGISREWVKTARQRKYYADAHA